MILQSRPTPRAMQLRPSTLSPSNLSRTFRALMLTGTAIGLLAACDRPLDFDMRGNFGNTLDTAEAARQPVANRPAPDRAIRRRSCRNWRGGSIRWTGTAVWCVRPARFSTRCN